MKSIFKLHFYEIRLYQASLWSKHSFVLCSQEPNSDRLPRPLQAHCYNRITIFKAQKAITSCDLLGARVLQYRSHTGTTSSYVKHISNTIYYQVTQNLPALIVDNYDYNSCQARRQASVSEQVEVHLIMLFIQYLQGAVQFYSLWADRQIELAMHHAMLIRLQYFC